jgi:hypothetical protein
MVLNLMILTSFSFYRDVIEERFYYIIGKIYSVTNTKIETNKSQLKQLENPEHF